MRIVSLVDTCHIVHDDLTLGSIITFSIFSIWEWLRCVSYCLSRWLFGVLRGWVSYIFRKKSLIIGWELCRARGQRIGSWVSRKQ